MISISPKHINLENLRPAQNFELDILVKRSKEVMSEYGTFFKSKTLEKLYTPEYHYQGSLPKTTYIIDKKTGKRKLMFITRSKHKGFHEGTEEQYSGWTYGLRSLGEKSFETIDKNGNPKISPGAMISDANHRYAGTQIRLTQIEVERAMQIGEKSIPLHALPEALPFHTMMGFRPNTQYSAEVKSLADVEKEMFLITGSSILKKEFFTPIVHSKDGKYYFDRNQTVANALIRFFKKEADEGVERNFHAVFPANSVDMNLSGTELEAWKQRALSQPILLKKPKKSEN